MKIQEVTKREAELIHLYTEAKEASMRLYPWTPVPCAGSHVATWTSNESNSGVPDGILCDCGRYQWDDTVRKWVETK